MVCSASELFTVHKGRAGGADAPPSTPFVIRKTIDRINKSKHRKKEEEGMEGGGHGGGGG